MSHLIKVNVRLRVADQLTNLLVSFAGQTRQYTSISLNLNLTFRLDIFKKHIHEDNSLILRFSFFGKKRISLKVCEWFHLWIDWYIHFLMYAFSVEKFFVFSIAANQFCSHLRWVSKPEMLTKSPYLWVVWMKDGRIFTISGSYAGESLNTMEMLCHEWGLEMQSTRSWRQCNGMLNTRSDFPDVMLHEEVIIVAGGWTILTSSPNP